ncbi:MAG: hypothetical protein PHU78_02595 [Heliobacteriaceae bacterium]|nr:hypothetical protein [Heliobacteriaceae bacterium]
MNIRPWLNRGVILAVVIALSLALSSGFAYFSYAQSDVPKTSPQKEEVIPRPEAIQTFLNTCWNDVMQAHGIDITQWSSYDIADYPSLQENPPAPFESKDIGDITFSIHSAQLEQLGDSIPLLLLHPQEKKALHLFRRDFGKGAKVVVQIEPVNGQMQITSINEK